MNFKRLVKSAKATMLTLGVYGGVYTTYGLLTPTLTSSKQSLIAAIFALVFLFLDAVDEVFFSD